MRAVRVQKLDPCGDALMMVVPGGKPASMLASWNDQEIEITKLLTGSHIVINLDEVKWLLLLERRWHS